MATEKNFKKEHLRHGEAVGIGMLAELYYANKKRNKIFNTILKLLKIYGLPTSIDKKLFEKNNRNFKIIFINQYF